MTTTDERSGSTADINKPFRFVLMVVSEMPPPAEKKDEVEKYESQVKERDSWEEARKQEQKEEVLVVGNNNNTNKRSTVILKPNGKNLKNQNHKLCLRLHLLFEKKDEVEKYESQAQNKEFLLESLITRLRIKEEARKQDQKEEVLVVGNNNNTNKRSTVVLKPNGKNFKNQNRKANPNCNSQPRTNNNNQNWNHQRNQNNRQQVPPNRNDSNLFMCYNCNKPGHMARKCKNKPSSAPQAKLTGELSFTAMISEINLIGGFEGW
ncbi:uncharacterized protein LOC115710870 [Cannabis sativa]|uniref:uncharacterized protein LOC115710870 n=1 Tax=Cannabis sativa TaxID=3483 RepID=UPI0029CA62C6|nr:uncharacterized protein LOC115710870 [Cannabis sativa]